MENINQNKSYLAFYEKIGLFSFGGSCKIIGPLQEGIKIDLSKIALETGMVTIEESKRFVQGYQVWALKTGKTTVEEALRFVQEYQVSALETGRATVEEALSFVQEVQVLALKTGKTTTEEAIMFTNDVQVVALREINNITVRDALKLSYCFQVDLLKTGRFTVEQVSGLKNIFSDKLALVMNISVEESINYINNNASILNENYYRNTQTENKCRLTGWSCSGLDDYIEPIVIKLNNNCNLNLFLTKLCYPGSNSKNLIHMAEINLDNQLVPINISASLDPYYQSGRGSTDINQLTEIYHSLFD